MTETLAVDRWIYDTLTNDGTLMALCPGGVHEQPAPLDVKGLFVVFAVQTALDTTGLGAARILTSGVWQIRVVGENVPTSTLGPAAARIDQLLQGQRGSNADGRIYGCVRTGPLRLPAEVSDGRIIRSLGGLYRITVS